MLEQYGLKTGVMPIDGWRYEQAFEGGVVRIPFAGCAGDGSTLVEMVRDFRISNILELGNPELDVANYIRAASPINDKFPGKLYGGEEPDKTGFIPLIQRIKEWLVATNQRRPKPMLVDEAEQRAKVCATCRQNVEWKTGCIPCYVAIDSLGQNIRQLPANKAADSLHACRLHALHLPTAVFLDIDDLPARHEQAPAPCWINSHHAKSTRNDD